MDELSTNKAQYNNCFTLGGKSKRENGAFIKVPMFIDWYGYAEKLWGGKDGRLSSFYELSYDRAKQILDRYLKSNRRVSGDESLRVSLYLDNAMYGNLHIFVIDFDSFDKNSGFFQSAKNLADKVTRSQSGGYHMFYGINKEASIELFDRINLLASGYAQSYVCHTGAVTLDDKNKVDFFCDAYHFIYEWEPWNNTIGLTDKTQELYELIGDNFSLKRPGGSGQYGKQSGKQRKIKTGRVVLIDEKAETELLSLMANNAQREVFANLKTLSPDCDRKRWYSIGLDVWKIFGDDLGGEVFRSWSALSQKKFNPRGCAITWGNICECGPDTDLWNDTWREMFNAFDT